MNKFEQLYNSVLNEGKSHIQELADQIAQQKNVIKTDVWSDVSIAVYHDGSRNAHGRIISLIEELLKDVWEIEGEDLHGVKVDIFYEHGYDKKGKWHTGKDGYPPSLKSTQHKIDMMKLKLVNR